MSFSNPNYKELFRTMIINSDRKSEAERCSDIIIKNRSRYEFVEKSTKVPWYVVGIIHYLESGFSFNKHLHNGDPLTSRTKNYPPNRPVNGNPPFTWEESAIDALNMKKRPSVWNIETTLEYLEKYNGLGYRKKGIYSPYLWSATNHYVKGKYVSDGRFNPDAVSKQIGGAAILLILIKRDIVKL